MGRKRLVHGVGINDADYKLTIIKTIDGKRVIIRRCPFYTRWVGLLERCYSASYQLKRTNYKDCSVADEWFHFSKFRAWMIAQDWEGKELDKDILFPNNKHYSPETCVFVEQKINSFITERNKARGEWPIGVSLYKRTGKFLSQGHDVITGKKRHLGLFDTPEEAHDKWLAYKLEQAHILASQQTYERVAKALIDRYENYRSFPNAA